MNTAKVNNNNNRQHDFNLINLTCLDYNSTEKLLKLEHALKFNSTIFLSKNMFNFNPVQSNMFSYFSSYLKKQDNKYQRIKK